MGVDSPQNHFPAVILAKLMAKITVYMGYKITPTPPSITRGIHFLQCISPTLRLKRKVRKGEKTLLRNSRICEAIDEKIGR